MAYPTPHPPPFGLPPPPPPPPSNHLGPRNPIAVVAIAAGIAVSILAVMIGALYVFSSRGSRSPEFHSVAVSIGSQPAPSTSTPTTRNPHIPPPTDPPRTDDKTLEALGLACWSGRSFVGCDDLGKAAETRASEPMALYARTCGGRIPDPGPSPPLTCEEIFGE